jgi:hypothetical protein
MRLRPFSKTISDPARDDRMVDALLGVVDRCGDVLPFKIGRFVQNLVKTESNREQVKDIRHSNSHAPKCTVGRRTAVG